MQLKLENQSFIINNASSSQIQNLNSGKIRNTDCLEITTAYSIKLASPQKGSIVSASIQCPGIDEIGAWYSSSNEGAALITALNATASSFFVFPRVRTDKWVDEIKALKKHHSSQ